MSNKLTTVIDAIETALAAVSGVKKVKRGIISPLQEKNPPVVALAVSRFRRRDGTWMCDCLIQCVPKRDSKTDPDEAMASLVADLQNAIDTIVEAGTAGAWIDGPTWDAWYTPDSGDFPLRPVGAVGLMTIRIDGSLKSS